LRRGLHSAEQWNNEAEGFGRDPTQHVRAAPRQRQCDTHTHIHRQTDTHVQLCSHADTTNKKELICKQNSTNNNKNKTKNSKEASISISKFYASE